MSVTIPTDRDTGRPRGFAFVEFSDRERRGGDRALDGQELEGYAVRLSWAREREEFAMGASGRGAHGGSKRAAARGR